MLRAIAILGLVLCVSAGAHAEILVRWDQDPVPSPQSLGLATLVVPEKKDAVIRSALAQGYRVYVEADGSALDTFTPPAGVAGVIVRGPSSSRQRSLVARRLPTPGARVLTLDERGKWPHIRSNWVTKNGDVLQVSGRSAQPWIESNAAMIGLLRTAPGGRKTSPPLLTYRWQPITLADRDEGPALENYLVAIAEAGSFGADLLLPLHERFQRSLILGQPRARADWTEIRRYLDFYAWDLALLYRPIATVGIVAAEPMLHFEVMNLLSRHNVPFRVVAPAAVAGLAPGDLRQLIVLDAPEGPVAEALAAFERNGGKVVNAAKGIADPNAFALEMRRILPPEHRAIDVWNGITVMAAPYGEPDGSMLVTAVNYAHQTLPVQVRVGGTFSSVEYESPEERAVLLPFEHRDGCTEFVLPALRIGGRVFLARNPR